MSSRCLVWFFVTLSLFFFPWVSSASLLPQMLQGFQILTPSGFLSPSTFLISWLPLSLFFSWLGPTLTSLFHLELPQKNPFLIFSRSSPWHVRALLLQHLSHSAVEICFLMFPAPSPPQVYELVEAEVYSVFLPASLGTVVPARRVGRQMDNRNATKQVIIPSMTNKTWFYYKNFDRAPCYKSRNNLLLGKIGYLGKWNPSRFQKGNIG